MRIPKFLLTAIILFNLSQSLFAQLQPAPSGYGYYVEAPVAAGSGNSGFTQLWHDNAIMWKYGNFHIGGLRFGSATDLNAANWTERMKITDDGKVGIGTPNPFYTLDVIGQAKGSDIVVDNGAADGGRLILYSAGNPEWRVRNFGGLGFFPGEGKPTALWLDNSGNVCIGGQNPHGFKLAVNGNAIFTKVVVKDYNNWPDYVFNTTYRLRPLSEVEQYINEHHHLPEVVSAEEVQKNGLDISENQAALLKKIEELTLYVIEQEKKINSLANENKELKLLKKEMEELKNALKQVIK
jgi:hypothetical protein